MYKVAVKGEVENKIIEKMTAEQVEGFLRDNINNSILKGIDAQLDNFSFIDLEQNMENDTFEWSADIVICSAQQVDTSIGMVVKNLTAAGISPEEIGRILEPLSTDMKGW